MLFFTADGGANAWYNEQLDEDQQWLADKQKKRIEKANQQQIDDDQQPTKKKKTTLVKFNNEIQTKFIENNKMSDEEEEEEEEETPVMKEDIYGRTIDAKGNVVKNDSSKNENMSSGKYIPPALRQKLNSSDEESSLSELKRRLHGQLNRLSEKNLSSILNEIENIYRLNSRALVNSSLYELYKESLLSTTSLTNESLLAEHSLLISLLHANIGLEIGSFLFEYFIQIFLEHFHDDISTKINDNLILFLSYCYAFHITNSKIILDFANYLLTNEQLNEKRLELILLLLRTVGFILRKDNPLELKTFLQQLKTISSSSVTISTSSKRMEFMIMTIQSLKNNDIRKLPGEFDHERIERLRKIYKNLVKDKSAQLNNQINVGLQDFLNAKEQGRWWIVGSAWQQQQQRRESTNGKSKENSSKQQFNQKILKLAKKQHMNTDLRKNIFAILLTSEVRLCVLNSVI